MAGSKSLDTRALLKRAFELCMPDLRSYYRVVRKARVVAAYASDGRYWADVQPLRNDESEDAAEPVVPKVEIPILWGGPRRGVVCPPAVGTLCDLEYYDGDPNYPRISNFRWYGQQAPQCDLGALIIQQAPGVSIEIDPDGRIITLTPTDVATEAGGAVSAEVGGNWTVQVAGTATLRAPLIVIEGNVTSRGAGGGVGAETKSAHTEHEGSYLLLGNMQIQGDVTVSGTVLAGQLVGPHSTS